MCLSPLGDTLFATPAIRALRETFPQARFVVLATSAAAQVLKRNPFQIQLITITEKWDLFRYLNRVRKENFDLAISLSQLGGFFTRFCATKQWSDFTLIEVRQDHSVIQMCASVLKLIGVNPISNKTEFWFNEQDQEIAELFLKGSNYDPDKPLIAIHSGGHYFIRKRWPINNYIQLIKFLTRNDYQVVLIGGQEDLEDSLLIRSEVPEIISTVGMLKLTETGALLKRCRFFVGNDSGPLHLAAALNIPTIGLFGPTHPQQFYPYPSPYHSFIYKNLSCSPCYRFGGGIWQNLPRCSKAYCMEAISFEDLVCQLKNHIYFKQEPMGWLYAGRT